MVIWSLGSGLPLRINAAFSALLGLHEAQLQSQPFLAWIEPEDRSKLEALLLQGWGTAQARHLAAGGESLAFLWTLKQQDGADYLLGMQQEAGPQQASSEAPEGIQTGPSLSKTLDAMARIVEAKHPGMLCSVLLVDSAGEYIVGGAGPSLPDSYNKKVEGLRIGPAVGSCGSAAFWNVPMIVEDIFQDPLWKDLRGAAKDAGVAACWSNPITATNGDVLGAMALYDPKPRSPTRSQLDSLGIAARMVGLAVERDRLEGQLQQAAKMEALGVLAGGIAHDFNNMLASIMGNTELALAQLPADDASRSNLEEVLIASGNAADLCNQMLAYAGRSALSTELVECNSMLEELGGLLRVALSKKVNLDYELHESPLGILADRSQIRQVIMNLITNASESLGNTTGRISIGSHVYSASAPSIEEQLEGLAVEPVDYVVLRVSDTGPGMASAIQSQIFDPFFTTKSSGRGLGLAAVQGIVRGHQGAIVVDSVEGKGTTVSVYLPRVDLAQQVSDAGIHSKPTNAQGRILVVDDEPQVRATLKQILEHGGYSVLCASDGREALELFRSEGPRIDCVLLDLSMPELDGQEVFEELQRLQSDVRVVLSSGFAEQDIIDKFNSSGLAGVVQKPASMQVLLAKIAEAISSKNRNHCNALPEN